MSSHIHSLLLTNHSKPCCHRFEYENCCGTADGQDGIPSTLPTGLTMCQPAASVPHDARSGPIEEGCRRAAVPYRYVECVPKRRRLPYPQALVVQVIMPEEV